MDSRRISVELVETPNSDVDGAAPVTMRRQDILKDLECPICNEQIWPPVQDCENGHHLCSLCLEKVDNVCPICKSKTGVTRNRFAEQFLDSYVVRCGNHIHGCNAHNWKEQVDLLKAHEESCKYRKIQCWVPNCDTQVFPDGLENHWLQGHGIEVGTDQVAYQFKMQDGRTPFYESKAFHMQHNGNSFLAIFQTAALEGKDREAGVYVYGYCPRDVLSYYQIFVTLTVMRKDNHDSVITNTYKCQAPVHHESEHPAEIERTHRDFHEILPSSIGSTVEDCLLTILITTRAASESSGVE